MAEVELIEPNSIVSIFDHAPAASWGLDRVSRRDLPLNGTYSFIPSAGEGVDVYVVDTGINVAHEDFEGRAVWGYTAPRGDQDVDGNGHGTHVASTIAGKKYGIAKKANVIAVKVLRSSGYGSMADVLKGIEWAAAEHVRKNDERKTKSIGNMSLGGGRSRTLDKVVNKAIEKGVLFAVAAGNDNRDACDYSPARADKAVTVGATDRNDKRSYFSNWGECVDIFAPGSMITGAWIGSKTAEKTISGTSMASPHVAGVLALLAGEHEDMTPSELKKHLLALATPDKVSDVREGSPNLLLYSNPLGDENSDKAEEFMGQKHKDIPFSVHMIFEAEF